MFNRERETSSPQPTPSENAALEALWEAMQTGGKITGKDVDQIMRLINQGAIVVEKNTSSDSWELTCSSK